MLNSQGKTVDKRTLEDLAKEFSKFKKLKTNTTTDYSRGWVFIFNKSWGLRQYTVRGETNY